MQNTKLLTTHEVTVEEKKEERNLVYILTRKREKKRRTLYDFFSVGQNTSQKKRISFFTMAL